MIPIDYVTGDATAPNVDGPKIIAHVCNDLGAWGAGFVLAVSARWPEPKQAYLRTCELAAPGLLLGRTDLVTVGPDLHVANMFAQQGFGRTDPQRPPIRYEALSLCLRRVGMHARVLGASVHMPRIGCGIAGGKWAQVEPIIVGQLCVYDIAVTVYDLPQAFVPAGRLR